MRSRELAQRFLPLESVLERLGRLGQDAGPGYLLFPFREEPAGLDVLGDDEEGQKREQQRQRAFDDEEVEPLVVVGAELEDAVGDQAAKGG